MTGLTPPPPPCVNSDPLTARGLSSFVRGHSKRRPNYETSNHTCRRTGGTDNNRARNGAPGTQ